MRVGRVSRASRVEGILRANEDGQAGAGRGTRIAAAGGGVLSSCIDAQEEVGHGATLLGDQGRRVLLDLARHRCILGAAG